MNNFHIGWCHKMHPRIPHARVWHSCLQPVCNQLDAIICSSCYGLLSCVTFAMINVSQPGYQTYALLVWNVSSLASSVLTSSNSTSSSTAWLRVIVTSPTGRWKLLVSLCHLSVKVDISPLSPVFKEHAIKVLNPVAVIVTYLTTERQKQNR